MIDPVEAILLSLNASELIGNCARGNRSGSSTPEWGGLVMARQVDDLEIGWE